MTNLEHTSPVQMLDTSESVQAFLEPTAPHILCFGPEVVQSQTIQSETSLIILFGDHSGTLLMPNIEKAPTSTPFLILDTNGNPPDIPEEIGQGRLIDFVRLPATPAHLLRKISFLQQVQKIASDHHTNTTTLYKQLTALSTRDGLTGLLNRRQFTSDLLKYFQSAQDSNTDMSLLIVNVDYFNQINKSAGLEFGDFILNEMSARLTINTEETDSCYRFSGEDFVVLMPRGTLEQACLAGEKIREACANKSFDNGQQKKSITISAGVTSMQSHAPLTAEEFISMAEAALFIAKAEGRNRVRVFSQQGNSVERSQHKSMAILKETLDRILSKTRLSAISSLQLLTKNVVGPEHQNHIATVSHYVTLLGDQLNLPKNHITTFQNAITLYNSIRFLLHSDLISKPRKLTEEERKKIIDLPIKLTEITDMFDYFTSERTVLLFHSERYDGTGTPNGLKGDEIPLGARIFNIIDSFAAMNSDRPYRPRLTPLEIINELVKEAGKQFDPILVMQTLRLIEENSLLDLEKGQIHEARQELIKLFPEL